MTETQVYLIFAPLVFGIPFLMWMLLQWQKVTRKKYKIKYKNKYKK